MTQKTCFCHLIFKQTTPKDMEYNFKPDNRSSLNCKNCSIFVFKVPKDTNISIGLLEMKMICTIKTCQLNHR